MNNNLPVVNYPVSDLPEIKIEVDGQKITGKIIYLSSSDVAVEITSPYKNLQSSDYHIPSFALMITKKWYADSHGITKRGVITSEILLKNIYLIVKYFESNLAFLNESYNFFKDIIDEQYSSGISDESFILEKSELKKSFKKNEINEKEYFIKMKQLKRYNQEYFNKNFEIIYQFRVYLKEESGIDVDDILCNHLIRRYILGEE